MSRIALDLRMLVHPPDGISRYSLELLRRVAALAPRHELFAIGRPGDVRRYVPGASVLPSRTTSISAGEQVELPVLLATGRIDLFHATLFVAPLITHRPYVLTLHDVNYMVLPELYGRGRQLYFETAVRLFARRARAIITVSEFSREEIVRRLGVPRERIEVIANGVDPRFAPAGSAAIAELRRRLGLPDEYLLYVGSFVPHKNVPFLLRAYSRVKGAPPLVLCGRDPDRIRPEIDRLGLRDRVLPVPGQGDEALPLLYSGASAFVFPSRYEGFGLPPLEAMACGAPTIVSDAGSLPEVTGGAALTFPLDDEAALASRIEEVLRSADTRARLSSAGRAQAARFRWESCAGRHLALYERCL